MIVTWDGKNLPKELRDLPPGTYQIEPAEAPALTAEEEEGLRAALRSVRPGVPSTLPKLVAASPLRPCGSSRSPRTRSSISKPRSPTTPTETRPPPGECDHVLDVVERLAAGDFERPER